MHLNCLGHDGFQSFIGGLYLAIGLWMVRGRFSVLDFIVVCYLLHQLRSKMRSLIRKNFPRNSKSNKYLFKEKIDYCLFCGSW